MRADALAMKYIDKDMVSLWKDIAHINTGKPMLAPTIEGVSGDNNIADLWKIHFDDILNCNTDVSQRASVLRNVQIVN